MAFHNCPYAKDYYKEHGENLTNDQYMDLIHKINELKSPEAAIALMKGFDEYTQSKIARSDVVLHSWNGAHVKEMLQTLFEEGNVVTRCEVAFAARRYMEQCYNRFKDEPSLDFAEKLSGKDTLEKKCVQYFQKEDLSNALIPIASTIRANKALLKENTAAFGEKLQESILDASKRGKFYRLNEVLNRFAVSNILSEYNLDSITGAQFVALVLPEDLKNLTADAKRWYSCINEEIEEIVGKDIDALREEALQTKSVSVNMGKEDLLAAIEKDASLILQIKEYRTPEFLLEAVKRNGQVLLHLDKSEHTPEIQLEAVKNFGPAISAIVSPSEELQLIAINQMGTNLQFIKEESLTPKACLTAILNSKEAYEYVPVSFDDTVNWWEENVQGFHCLVSRDRADVIQDLEYIQRITPEAEYKKFYEKAIHDPNPFVRNTMIRKTSELAEKRAIEEVEKSKTVSSPGLKKDNGMDI